MNEQADTNNKGLRILLEALTTISYLKGGDGRAAAIAEYALDQYGKTILKAGASGWEAETQGFPGPHPEQRHHTSRRRIDRRCMDSSPSVGQAERRLAERRVNPDRRCKP